MPKKRPFRLFKYDLKKKFTTTSGSVYYSSGDPTDNLILWARAATQGPRPTSAEDASGVGHTVVFQDSGGSGRGAQNQPALTTPFSSLDLANVNSAVRFPKSTTPYVQVSDADDLSFGDGSSDSSFSLAAWMLITSASVSTYIFKKGIDGGDDDFPEYEIIYHEPGALTGTLTDDSASASLNFKASVGSDFNVNDWHHIAFTYSAALTKTGRGKFYLDGKFMSGTCTEAGTYVAMEPGEGNLLIADNDDNQPVEFQEAAIWSGKVLGAEDINALYNASKGIKDVYKERVYISSTGITSLPVRPYLQSIDNATGSYPSTYRLGDSRTGHYSSSFDETKAIRFQKAGTNTGLTAQVILGQQLISGSQYSGSLVVAPNTLPDLELTSSATSILPGVSDARVRFTPGDDYAPFVESGQFAASMAGSPDPFWGTGSQPREVGPGLSYPLWSKTKLEIDLNPSVPTVLTFSTGSSYTQSANLYGTRGGINSGLAYYNFDLSRWEIHGNFYTGSNVDYYSQIPYHQTGSLLAFSPGYTAGIEGGQLLRRSDGDPTDLAGFPYASKFNPTSSQQFSVNNVIKYPFLVEKLAYEFSGSLPFLATGAERSNIMQFFIMNEPGYNLQGDAPEKITRIMTGAYDGNANSFSVNGYGEFSKIFSQSFGVNRVRDLVTYSLISTYNSTAVTKGFDAPPDKGGYRRDLNVIYDSIADIPTGSFIVSASIRSPLPSEGMGVLQCREQALSKGTAKIKNQFGGRTGMTLAHNGVMVSPRSFTDSVATLRPSGSFIFDEGGAGYRNLEIVLNEKTSEISPYLLLPGDKLTFGWANQQQPVFNSTTTSEAEVAGCGAGAGYTNEDGRLTIAPGAGKLVLYGCMLRDGKEFHMGLNQHLTSDAIHETVQSSDIKSTPYCIDQWDSDYYFSLSGSYTDYAVEGIQSRKPTVGAGRLGLVPRSVIGGQAGTTGSILRGVRLIDLNERYLDSLFPDVNVIAFANSTKIRWDASDTLSTNLVKGKFAFYPLGTGGTFNGGDLTWPRSFPFDDRYGGSDLKRVTGFISTIPQTNLLLTSDPASEQFVNITTMTGQQDAGESSSNSYVTLVPTATTCAPLPDAKAVFLKSFYGFGDSVSFNLPKVIKKLGRTRTATVFGGRDVEIRGFKYGLLSALPTFTSAIYRRDRFGQARDLLEQRQYSAFEKYKFTIDSDNPQDPEGQQREIPGQLAAAVSIEFKKVSATGNSAEILPLDKSDFKSIQAITKNNLRGVWNRGCNVDSFARVQRPFFDANPLFPSGSFDEEGEAEKGEFILTELNQGNVLPNVNNIFGF